MHTQGEKTLHTGTVVVGHTSTLSPQVLFRGPHRYTTRLEFSKLQPQPPYLMHTQQKKRGQGDSRKAKHTATWMYGAVGHIGMQ